jgi:RNA polymerase sigma-70 factor (ECF subfamily)
MEITVKGSIKAKAIDWDAVYHAYVGKVFNFFRYRLPEEALSEDLTALTFEKAWKHRRQFRGTSEELPAWLFTIARNVLRDHFRRSKQTVPLEWSDEKDSSDGPETLAEQQMAFTRLVSLIQKLPGRERDLIALKFGAGLTNREIAQLTQLSETNVGSILHRSVVKLRGQIGVEK